MDMLTERGVISPQQGMGPRTILLDQDALVAILNGGDATSQIASAEGSVPDAGEDAGESAETTETVEET